MSKRVTVVLSDENIKKLRAKQAVAIKKSMKSVSFSKVINETTKITLVFLF